MHPEPSILTPQVVSRLATMEIRARMVVEGFMTGLHRSPYHGFSVEFAEHRQYMPGDEIRHVDWKVYGRTNRHYIKQYEEETNLKAYLVVDASASMGFRRDGAVSKLEYAATLASALGYLMMRQQDAVGLVTFDEALRSYLPPRATSLYLRSILAELQNLRPSGTTRTATALHGVAERLRRRGLVILFSDLFDDPAQVLTALKHFRYQQHEVIVFHILDPAERTFDFGRDAIFRDMESREEILTQPHQIQAAYRKAMEAFITTYKRDCRNQNIDYVLLDTATPFDKALAEYLTTRHRIGG